jgi:HAMP domain-containing protein
MAVGVPVGIAENLGGQRLLLNRVNGFYELIFHTHWWLPAGIAVFGVVLFWTGNHRLEARVRTAGLIAVALAVVLGVVSYLVDTDLERAVDRSRELTRSVERHDWEKMRNILDKNTSVGVLGAKTVYANRDKIVQGAQDGVDLFGLQKVRILSMDGQQDQSRITVTMDVLTEQTQNPPTLPSSWQFDWDQTTNGIVLRRITCLRIGNAQGENAQVHFPKK